MKRTAVTFLTVIFMGASLMLLEVPSAEAHNCSSLCNQIRRACIKVAKSVRLVARADCDEQRDTCREGCVTNAETCPTDCEAANAACVAACSADPVCEAGCAATLTQCLDDCANCIPNCNADREGCLEAAQVQRQADKLACDASRGNCGELCVDPIDSQCVKECKSLERICKSEAKKIERQCKRDCARGRARRACVRGCRRQLNTDLQLCSNQEILCLGACAGIVTP